MTISEQRDKSFDKMLEEYKKILSQVDITPHERAMLHYAHDFGFNAAWLKLVYEREQAGKNGRHD